MSTLLLFLVLHLMLPCVPSGIPSLHIFVADGVQLQFRPPNLQRDEVVHHMHFQLDVDAAQQAVMRGGPMRCELERLDLSTNRADM